MNEVARLSAVLSILSIGACVHLCARIWTPRRLFFVALDRELSDPERQRSRRLLALNAALTLSGVGFALSVPAGRTLVWVAYVLPLISLAVLLAEALRIRRSGSDARVPERFSVPLAEPPGPLAYTSPALWLAHGSLVALSFLLFASLVHEMPERVPVKWGLDGQVLRRGSAAELWSFGGVMLFQLLVVLGVAWSTSSERWALPARDQERYVALQHERRRGMVRMLEVLLLVTNVGVAILWFGAAHAALTGHAGVDSLSFALGMVVVFAGGLVPIALFMGHLMRVQEQIREIAESDVLGTRPSGWRWGGLVYYAPEDPAVFVPKRIGLGQTVNLARPTAWAVLGVPVLFSVAVVLLAVLT